MSKRYNAEREYDDQQRDLDALEKQLVAFGAEYQIQRNVDGLNEPYVFATYEARGVRLTVEGAASKVLSILTRAGEV